MSRLARCALVLASFVLALTAAMTEADAKRPGKRANKRHGHARNMPPGWTWPPSPAMRAEGEACLKRLDALGVAWRPAPATRKVSTPIYVPDMVLGGVALVPIGRKGPQVMDCQLARALADGAGAALTAAGVKALRFSSIHVYRTIAHTRILSRHALGLAMDVYEIVDAEGVVHVVKRAYPDAILLEAERRVNESGAFRGLLTPGNDPRRHDDHFHFEARSPSEKRPVETPPAPPP
jgi:hypothetical protein